MVNAHPRDQAGEGLAERAAVVMTDTELRALCHRFFDALEARDLDGVADCYAPDMAFWINVTGEERSRAENLAALTEGYGRHRRRTYNDRIINTFEEGFLVRYTVQIVQHDGATRGLWACLVARCREGRIVRIDEYLDSGKFAAPLPARKKAS